MEAMIFSSWFNVDVPGNSGWPSRISPKMQPKLHISTPFVYLHRISKQPSRVNKGLDEIAFGL